MAAAKLPILKTTTQNPSTLSLTGLIFQGNGPVDGTRYAGGMITTSKVAFTATDFIFQSAEGAGDGGAIYTQLGSVVNAYVYVVGTCHFGYTKSPRLIPFWFLFARTPNTQDGDIHPLHLPQQ